MEITHATLDQEVELRYPPSTHVSQGRLSLAPRGFNPFSGTDQAHLGFLVTRVMQDFLIHHYRGQPTTPYEDLFITIAFTTTDVLIEVSDRMAR